jgi:cytoskeletal protein RodZ
MNMNIPLMLAALSPLLASSALAVPLFTDKGADLENDPYSHDSSLTQGAMEDFRTLYVDPTDFAAKLVPVEPLAAVVETKSEPQAAPEGAETATSEAAEATTETDADASEASTETETDANASETDATNEASTDEGSTAEGAAELAQATPAAPVPPAKGNLIVNNDVTAWAEVTINGTKVGTIGPVTKGIVHDVASGVYKVDFLLPNGYSYTRTVATTLAP